MNNFNFMRLAAITAVATAAMTASSCSDDDNDKKNSWDYRSGAFFLSVSGESAEYVLQVEDIESGQIPISGGKELELSGYTWIFNRNPSVGIGLIYQQGDPGVCLGYGVNTDGSLVQLGEFLITSRFTSYGFFQNYALTSVGGQTPVDANGNSLLGDDGQERSDGVTFNFIDLSTFNRTDKTITTLNMTGNGELATLSGIVDMGNGTFLTGLVCSQPKDESATGGSSSGTVTYPDSVWIAAFDTDLNLRKIYRDDRISYSAGRYRSQYYSQIGKADDGTVYVFSGSYDYNNTATTRPCGALRINRNADEFDPDYYFNIEDLSGGFRFRKQWHITGDYFLLEFYNHTGRLNAIDDPATQYAVVDMTARTLKWLGGEFPARDAVTGTGTPLAYQGKMYFPVTEEGKDPAIYVIDPTTGNAVRGLSVRGASGIRAVGRLVD